MFQSFISIGHQRCAKHIKLVIRFDTLDQ